MTTVFVLAGAFGSPVTGPYAMPLQLKGELTAGKTVQPILYSNWLLWPDDNSMNAAAALIESAVTSTAGPKILFGHSLGALAVGRWLNTATAVNHADMSCVLIGSSVGPYGGFLRDLAPGNFPPADTDIPVVAIANQFDGWADYPTVTNSPYFMVAALDAMFGANTLHDYKNTSYTKAIDGTYPFVVQGNIRHVWAPSYPVPILGQPALAPTTTDYVNNFVAGIKAADKIGVYPGPLVPTARGGLAQLPPARANTPLSDADRLWRNQIEQAYNRPVAIPDP